MTVEKILFALFRSEICGETLLDEYKNAITPETASALYSISKSHDLAHLVCEALDKNGVLAQCGKELEEAFCGQRHLAVCRYEQMKYEYARICNAFEEAKIDYMPLKGAVIRAFYPQPWLRTSCDIDILVKNQDLDKATQTCIKVLGYTFKYKADHDASLFSEGGIHLELHFRIEEDLENIDPLLSRVWEFAEKKAGTEHQYIQTREYFVFHHLAHASYHFLSGGCGLRTIIDLWLLQNRYGYDEQQLLAFCKECGLGTFYKTLKKLTEIWFANETYDDLTKQTEDYILRAGVYGTLENKIAVKQTDKGGKCGYVFFRIFPPIKQLRIRYPVLYKHKWLLPLCWVRRWFATIFKGRVGHSVRELNVNAGISQERQQVVEMLLQNLGL